MKYISNEDIGYELKFNVICVHLNHVSSNNSNLVSVSRCFSKIVSVYVLRTYVQYIVTTHFLKYLGCSALNMVLVSK